MSQRTKCQQQKVRPSRCLLVCVHLVSVALPASHAGARPVDSSGFMRHRVLEAYHQYNVTNHVHNVGTDTLP